MKTIILATLCLVFTLPAYSEDKKSKIYGTWSSDRDATIEYLQKNAKLSEYQQKALPMLFGRMDVTYKEDGTGTVTLKATKIPKKDGGVIELEESQSNFTYTILGETKSQAVIKITGGIVLMDAPYSLIRFDGPDLSSISLSDSLMEINGREFFRRIPIMKTQSEQAAPSNR